jgi:hypothetical protein
MKETENISHQVRADRALTLRMLRLFVGTAKKCARKIRSSIKQSNWKELKSIAHKNISTYNEMGLDDLVHFLKYIESNAMNKGKRRSLQETVKTLNSKNSEAIDAVRKYIGLIRNEDLISDAELYNYGI